MSSRDGKQFGKVILGVDSKSLLPSYNTSTLEIVSVVVLYLPEL